MCNSSNHGFECSRTDRMLSLIHIFVPDTEKGTSADSDSGMQGVYMTISSDLTLSGTPKDPGSYLVSVSIEDQQGRSAVSNLSLIHI